MVVSTSRVRPSPIGRVLGAGGCEVMYAIRSYADENGDHRCDVFNPESAISYIACPVFNGNTNKIGAPQDMWAGEDLTNGKYPLVITLSRSGGRGPVVLGRVDNPNIYYTPSQTGSNSGGQPTASSTNGEVGAPASITVDDIVIQNDESRLILRDTKFGNDVFVVSARDIQLVANNGKVLVSKDSDAKDAPVLGIPYSKRDEEILNYCKAIADAVQGLHNWAKQATFQTLGVTPVLTFTTGSPSDAPATLDPATVRSAVLRVASDVESE